MKKIAVVFAVALLFCEKMSFADDLVPATSDDQQTFDQQVAPETAGSDLTKKEAKLWHDRLR